MKFREQEFQTLADNIPDLIVRYDKDLRRIYVNPAWEAASGLTAWEVINKNIGDIPKVTMPINAEYEKKLCLALETGLRQTLEFTWENAHGETLYLEYTIVPEYDQSGKIVSVLAVGHDLTTRKLIERKLSESEERFREIFDQVSDSLILAEVTSDGHFRTLAINPSFEKSSGLVGKELVGKLIIEALPKEVARVAESACRRCLELGVTYEDDISFDMPSGLRFYRSTHIPVQNEFRQVHRIVIISRDITDIKLAELGARANLKFFESMDKVNRAIQKAETLEQMMNDVLDEVLVIFDCDRAYLQYPCDPNAATWSVPMERTHPEYPGAIILAKEIPMDSDVASLLKILLDSKGPVVFGPGSEFSLPEGISKRFNTKTFLSMCISPRGDMPWQFGIHQCSYDRIWTIDEQKLFQEIGRRLSDALTTLQKERALNVSEKKYRAIVETAQEGICISDEKFQITYLNNHLAEMFGYSPNELMGRSVLDFIHKKDLEKYLHQRDERKTGLKGTYEVRFIHKNGHFIHVRMAASPWFDESNKIIGSVGMVTDISALKNAQSVLRKYAERIINVQEEERFRLARELHDGIVQTLGSILHRFRSEQELESGLVENLLSNVIEEVRGISYQLRPSILDDLGLSTALKSLCSEFQARTKIEVKQNIKELSTSLDKNVELALYRIVQEAMGNIEKHSKATHAWISLLHSHSLLGLEISDNGKGFCYDSSKVTNTGLGLLHIKERSIGIGGIARIDSIPGNGTTIFISIPMKAVSSVVQR